MIILTDFHSFTVNEDKLENQSIIKISDNIQVKTGKWQNLLNSFPFIKKTLVNHLYIWIWLFWLTFRAWQWMKTNFKIGEFQDFCLGTGMGFWSKFDKLLKLLNTVPFINKTLINEVYIRISSFWRTFTVLQWMKKNFKISQFSRFLIRSEFASQVRILKWLKLLNSVPFVKKTLVNKVYIWIWSFWLTFTVLQWMKTNFKISQISDFC